MKTRLHKYMRAAFYGSIVAAIVCGAASSAQAELKVATVDVNKVINSSKEAQAERKKLDDMTLAAKKKVDAKRDSLKQMEDKLRDQKVAEDSKEAEQFRNDARDLDRLVKDSQDDIQKEFIRSNKELTDKTLGLVKKYASSNKIDLVLDKGEMARGPVLYAGPVYDVTDAIIEQMNK